MNSNDRSIGLARDGDSYAPAHCIFLIVYRQTHEGYKVSSVKFSKGIISSKHFPEMAQLINLSTEGSTNSSGLTNRELFGNEGELLCLFGKAGVILRPGESMVKQGKGEGNCSKGMAMGWQGILRGDFKERLEWEKVEGEMALTNKRLIVVGKGGMLKKEIVPCLELELERIRAISTAKRVMGPEKLQVSAQIGAERLEKMEFKAEDAPAWTTSIRNQISHINHSSSREQRKPLSDQTSLIEPRNQSVLQVR